MTHIDRLMAFFDHPNQPFPFDSFCVCLPPSNLSILSELPQEILTRYLNSLSVHSLDEHWYALEVQSNNESPATPLVYVAPSAKVLIIPPIGSLPTELKQLELEKDQRITSNLTELGSYRLLPFVRHHAAFVQDPHHPTSTFTRLKLEVENYILQTYAQIFLQAFQVRRDFWTYFHKVKTLFFTQKLLGGQGFSQLKHVMHFPLLAPPPEHSIVFDLDMSLAPKWANEKYHLLQQQYWLDQIKLLDFIQEGFFDPSLCEKVIALAYESTWETEWESSPYYQRAMTLKQSLPHSIKTLTITDINGNKQKIANHFKVTSKGIWMGDSHQQIPIEQICSIRGGKVNFFEDTSQKSIS